MKFQSAAHPGSLQMEQKKGEVEELVCWVTTGVVPSHGPVHSILAGAEVGHGVLDCRVREVGMLLCFEPQAGQTGVTGVSVHVGAGSGGIGARGCSHRHRVESCGAVEVVEVPQVVEPGGRNSSHR